ncbi:zinc finger BED domain-containing protein RICESLEEPER 2-like [Mercurialis annua]|uniref:zinc finger BED domain-containing protein RICESLEEPER 2-like n=1 Tax=Mercurialis annua TaxID=3986 RepID=UPI00215E097F|nr:zinc finger BED domain-containing protein RICESLEEPER 2-like [Mercurialis annua]
MDNAGNNNTAIAAFKKKMISWGTDVSKCQFLHMRCIAHVIDLVVSDGLKEMNTFVKKIRDCIRYIRNTPSRLKQFNDLAKDAKLGTKKSLCLDVASRWNSTYLMLDTACLFKSVFDSYEEVNENFRNDMIKNIPNILDWQIAKKFAICLSYFYVTTLRISGSLYMTSNMHFLEICDLPIMLDEMLFNDLLFSRSNLFGKIFSRALFDRVKSELYALFDEYQSAYLTNVSGSSFQLSSSQPIEGHVSNQMPILSPPLAKRHTSLIKAKFVEHNKGQAETGPRKSELETYLNEAPIENDEDFSIRKWWKLNARRFPILSRVARDILAVPFQQLPLNSHLTLLAECLTVLRVH